MIPTKITPETMLDLAARRWWLLAGPLVVALMIAVGLAVALPKLYKSEATILVEPQGVPSNYVASAVNYGIEERLQAMSQQILSRTRLLDIAKEFKLYPGQGDSAGEDVVDTMRQNIAVDTGGHEKHGQKEVNYFKLSFAYPKAEVAQRVTARLASLFIEENLRIRSEQARNTSDFLEKELNDLKGRLETQEKAISVYKSAYMGDLPQQLQANLGALSALQTNLQTNQAALSAAQERAMLTEKAMADLASVPLPETSDPKRLGSVSPEVRLAALKQQLPALEGRYTAKHPNVIRTKNEIARLEAALAKASAAKPGEEGLAHTSGADRGMTGQFITVKSDIQRLRQDHEAIKRKIALYQQRVETTPKREQELAILTRDYEMLQTNYQSLLKKRIDAKMAENLENKQQGEQFRLVDPANLPERPSKPDLRKLFVMAILLGLSLGAGSTFLLEYVDRSFKEREDLEAYLKLGVLAMIPLVKTVEQLRYEKRRKLVVAAACAVVFVLYTGVVTVAYLKGWTVSLPFLT